MPPGYFPGNLSLVFRGPRQTPPEYPTSRIQKGLILCRNGTELVEEGTGFGLPLARFGHRTVFPGSATVTIVGGTGLRACETPISSMLCGHCSWVVEYQLYLEETAAVTMVGRITSPGFYRTREFFSRLHRRRPGLRPVLDQASAVVKRISGMQTTFVPGGHRGTARLTYQFYPGENRLHVTADFRGLQTGGLTEIIVANEQGGRNFDRYLDSTGLVLSGDSIGTWNEVTAGRASLLSAGDKLAFTLERVAGARMFRGREVTPGRLDWAGLNYVISPQTRRLEYDIHLETAMAPRCEETRFTSPFRKRGIQGDFACFLNPPWSPFFKGGDGGIFWGMP